VRSDDRILHYSKTKKLPLVVSLLTAARSSPRSSQDLKYLEPSVALVLGFIGAKMIAEYFGVCIPTSTSLAVVAAFLGSGVGLSVLLGGGDGEAVEVTGGGQGLEGNANDAKDGGGGETPK